MTPEMFVAKWTASKLKESASSQEHFIDLCHLVGHPTPAESDSEGTSFCFERGAAKDGGKGGFADVWKKGFFAIEYKGKSKDLAAAYTQLLQYRENLGKAVKFGVPIAAGSDMYIELPGMTRGQASLLIFRAYTEAGMTPLQVIRAGTMNGADLIGERAMCGRLESGKFADVIAVSGDPMTDIRELERVKFVMSRGRVVRNDLWALTK